MKTVMIMPQNTIVGTLKYKFVVEETFEEGVSVITTFQVNTFSVYKDSENDCYEIIFNSEEDLSQEDIEALDELVDSDDYILRYVDKVFIKDILFFSNN